MERVCLCDVSGWHAKRCPDEAFPCKRRGRSMWHPEPVISLLPPPLPVFPPNTFPSALLSNLCFTSRPPLCQFQSCVPSSFVTLLFRCHPTSLHIDLSWYFTRWNTPIITVTVSTKRGHTKYFSVFDMSFQINTWQITKETRIHLTALFFDDDRGNSSEDAEFHLLKNVWSGLPPKPICY